MSIYQQTSNPAHSPFRVVEQTTGREVDWINRYLDREYVRRVADTTLRSYAHDLLHFLRWWASVHHTGDVTEEDLTESTLLDYMRFQSSQHPPPSASTINRPRGRRRSRLAATSFPMLPVRSPAAFIKLYWRRAPMGLGRPRPALSRLRVKTPKRIIGAAVGR